MTVPTTSTAPGQGVQVELSEDRSETLSASRIASSSPRDTESPTSASKTRWARAIPWLIAIPSTAAYLLLALNHWWNRVTGSWDLAIFVQAVKGYAHFSAPVVDLKDPGVNILGDHFSPILMTLAPVFRVAPHPLTLQVAQVLLVGLSTFVLARTAVHFLGPTSGALLGFSYAFSFGVQSAINFDFHEIAFAAPILAFAGDQYLRRRWTSTLIAGFVLLLVKEDLAPVVIMLGVALLLRGARKHGLVLICGALTYLALVVGWLIPMVNPRGRYDYLGVAQAGAGSGLGRTLLVMAERMVSPVIKPVTLAFTFLVSGFLAFGSPFALLLLPIFAERFISPLDTYWGPGYHYSLIPMVVVFVGAIEVIDGFRRRADRPAMQAVTRMAPITLAVVCVGALPVLPLRELTASSAWVRTPRAQAMDQLISRIPDGASVQADDYLDAFLVMDHRLYGLPMENSPIPRVGAIGADYIALDQRLWDHYDTDGVLWATALNHQWRYSVEFRSHDLVLLRRSDIPPRPAVASLP